jgi:hypothetical protein
MQKVLTLLIALLVVDAARSNEPDVLSRLMREPLTLFDWGLAQLDRDTKRVARDVFEDRLGPGRPAANARFDRERRLVILGATLALPSNTRSEATCIGAFREIVTRLASVAPRGESPVPWYLQSAFLPDGHAWAGLSEDIGTRLLEVVRLRITLIPRPSDTYEGHIRFVSCNGRLDARPGEIAVEEPN